MKIVAIGNSRGVRLPKELRDKYAMKDSVVVEEREDGLLLRGAGDRQLSWEETAKAMAQECEDWSGWDSTAADGLDPREKW